MLGPCEGKQAVLENPVAENWHNRLSCIACAFVLLNCLLFALLMLVARAALHEDSGAPLRNRIHSWTPPNLPAQLVEFLVHHFNLACVAGALCAVATFLTLVRMGELRPTVLWLLVGALMMTCVVLTQLLVVTWNSSLKVNFARHKSPPVESR